MKIIYELSPADIRKQIPYQMISEVGMTKIYRDNKIGRAFSLFFENDVERKQVKALIDTAYRWFVKGLPESVRYTKEEMHLWNRLQDFCNYVLALTK